MRPDKQSVFWPPHSTLLSMKVAEFAKIWSLTRNSPGSATAFGVAISSV